MKLRNKKTGAIYSIEDIDLGNNQDGIWLGLTRYTSLAELCEDWEDLEEDKRYWYIDSDGEVMSKEQGWFSQAQDDIGNRFETKEEAEKAVEKLKAWKRLKDNGISLHLQKRFRGDGIGYSRTIYTDFTDLQENVKDLDLLFGGEE